MHADGPGSSAYLSISMTNPVPQDRGRRYIEGGSIYAKPGEYGTYLAVNLPTTRFDIAHDRPVVHVVGRRPTPVRHDVHDPRAGRGRPNRAPVVLCCQAGHDHHRHCPRPASLRRNGRGGGTRPSATPTRLRARLRGRAGGGRAPPRPGWLLERGSCCCARSGLGEGDKPGAERPPALTGEGRRRPRLVAARVRHRDGRRSGRHLRHGSVIAPRSAPCARRAYLASTPGRVAGLGQLPLGLAALELVGGDVEVDRVPDGVDHDAVAVAHERDRSTVDGFRARRGRRRSRGCRRRTARR